MKNKSLFALALILGSALLTVGCSGGSEPAVDSSVPMGKADDKYKPTAVGGTAKGGNAPSSGGLMTPSPN